MIVAEKLPADMKVFVILDEEVFDPKRIDPLDLDEPEDIAFACFFKTDDDRAALLAALRSLATAPVDPAPGALGMEVAQELEESRLQGDAKRMLAAALRWWTGVKKRAYHAYKLRAGVDRYSCSCVVALREMQPAELKAAVDPAINELEEARERVAGFFQYPFD
jgi:hypothetical protein